MNLRMNLLHRKARRFACGTLPALVVIGLATLALLPHAANADNDYPVTLNVAAPELVGRE